MKSLIFPESEIIPLDVEQYSKNHEKLSYQLWKINCQYISAT
jgi:hypothetical protein